MGRLARGQKQYDCEEGKPVVPGPCCGHASGEDDGGGVHQAASDRSDEASERTPEANHFGLDREQLAALAKGESIR